METEDNIIFKSVTIACIAGIILISLLAFTGTKDTGFTELYFLDYEKAPLRDAVTFKYVITNHEGKETEYNIRFSINNKILRNRKTTLKDNETFTEEYTLSLDTNSSVTHKVIIDIEYPNKKPGGWGLEKDITENNTLWARAKRDALDSQPFRRLGLSKEQMGDNLYYNKTQEIHFFTKRSS